METHLSNKLQDMENCMYVAEDTFAFFPLNSLCSIKQGQYQQNWEASYNMPDWMDFMQTSVHVRNLPSRALPGWLLIWVPVCSLCFFILFQPCFGLAPRIVYLLQPFDRNAPKFAHFHLNVITSYWDGNLATILLCPINTYFHPFLSWRPACE